MEQKKTWVYKEEALKVRTNFEDFDGTVEKWKKAFYEVWRWQMTWSFAYTIKVHEYHDGDLGLVLLIKPAFKKSVLEMLEEYGYKNVKVENVNIGFVDFEVWSEDFDIDDVFME